MRKFVYGAVVFAALAIGVGPASANEFYFNLFAGGGIFQSNDNAFDYAAGGGAGFDDEGGLIFGGAAGMTVFDTFRAEVEASFTQFDDLQSEYSALGSIDLGTSVEALFVLANVWYDFQLSQMINPYVGGGIGFAWTEAMSSNAAAMGPEDTDVGIAFQVGGGVRVPMIENVDLDIAYRFKGVTDLEYSSLEGPTGQMTNGNLYIHALTAGITVHFGGNQ